MSNTPQKIRNAPSGRLVSLVTLNRLLVSEDVAAGSSSAGVDVQFDSPDPQTLTILNDEEGQWTGEEVLYVTQLGPGSVTVLAGVDVTLRIAASKGPALSERYVSAMLRRIGVNEWLLTGELV